MREIRHRHYRQESTRTQEDTQNKSRITKKMGTLCGLHTLFLAEPKLPASPDNK